MNCGYLSKFEYQTLSLLAAGGASLERLLSAAPLSERTNRVSESQAIAVVNNL